MESEEINILKFQPPVGAHQKLQQLKIRCRETFWNLNKLTMKKTFLRSMWK